MTKTMIAPLVAALASFIGLLIGHPIGQTIQDETTTIIVAAAAFGTTIYGIYKNHKK
jgi:uncharacterized membrane protein YqgA involved in biofilm formation